MGKQWKQWQTSFSWGPNLLQMVTAAMKLKDSCFFEEKLWPTYTAYWKVETLLCQQRSISQSYGFSSSQVWMWGLDHKESWALKIDAFELWCWRRLLRVPWTTMRSNQSILKEISPAYSLEGLMLKLKLQYFGYLMPRNDSLEKTLKLGKFEGRKRRDDRGWDGWMASPTRCTWVWVNSGSWWRTGRSGMLWFMGSQRSDTTEWLNWTELNWTELNWTDSEVKNNE